MSKSMPILAFAVIVGSAMVSGAVAGDGVSDGPALEYRFKMRSRHGLPGFAYEYFPRFEQRKPVVFVGKMAPQGLLIMMAPGDTKSTPESGRCVLRGKGVDITSHLQIAGAHYRKPGEKLKTVSVPLEKLPRIKVRYEPSLPEQITMPGKHNCVLLFQIGEGKEGEWAEGHWSVSVRFDPGKLNVRFAEAAPGGVPVRTKGGRVTVVYGFNFIAKKIKTKADRHNWLFYHYRDLERKTRSDQKRRNQVLGPLSELIEAYPTSANLFYERAQLLAEQGRYKEAIKDIDSIRELLKKGTLRTAFAPIPLCGRLSTKESVQYLDACSVAWAKKAATRPTTRPTSAKPGPAGQGGRKAGMTISMRLYRRMHPRLVRVSVHRAPGLILYPEYSNLVGNVACYGPEELLKGIAKDLGAEQARGTVGITVGKTVVARVVRFGADGVVVEQPKATAAMVIRLKKKADVKDGVEFEVRIPSEAARWQVGHYRMELGVWYRDAGARKTLAVPPVYFEVRLVAEGSGDEINLLSNAIAHEIPGLSERLLGKKKYARIGLVQRILALDPHDVFARHALIRKAMLLDADPDTAVTLWEAIRRDIANGKAHRAESLMNPFHVGRPRLITKRMLEMAADAGVQATKRARKLSGEAKKRVDRLLSDHDYKGVIALVSTGSKATLALVDNVWPGLWAIRAIKEARLKVAHEVLVKELAKLPGFPGMWQREIVDALTSIHGDKIHGDLRTRPANEGSAMIEWWLAHPRLKSGQPSSLPTATQAASSKPADAE